jgi:hypothetical protein
MKIGWFFLFAAATAVSGCASMDKMASNPMPRVQTAVFRVDDATSATQSNVLKTVATPDADQKSPSESKPMRIFWFLGGR